MHVDMSSQLLGRVESITCELHAADACRSSYAHVLVVDAMRCFLFSVGELGKTVLLGMTAVSL